MSTFAELKESGLSSRAANVVASNTPCEWSLERVRDAAREAVASDEALEWRNCGEGTCKELKAWAGPVSEMADRMLPWFAFKHLPPHLQEVSAPFSGLAYLICEKLVQGPERTVALRKLLEAKDAAVRAHVHPGG